MNLYEARVSFKEELAAGAAELRDYDVWAADQHQYPHVNSPERHTLEPVLGEGISLQSLVDQRLEDGKPTHVLELFGSADFLIDPTSADSLTGVRLADTIYREDPNRLSRERLPHHQVVLGDIYEEKTLTQVDKNLKNRGIPAIDLAVGAPYCGWGNWQRRYPLNVYLDTYYPMLQWTYDRLNPNGGMLLTELMPGRTRLTGNEAYAWESRMNDAGIVTNVAPGKRNFVAKIERQPTSPANIVPLQGRCVFRR